MALLAFAGLLIGHFMAYVVVAPDDGIRAAVLEATGHRGHDLFVPIGAAALLAAAIGLIARQLRRSPCSDDTDGSGWSTGWMLWLLQTTAFISLEAVERLASSHAVTELLHEPAFAVGIALQAAVAVVGTLFVLLLRATVAVLCRHLRPRREPKPASPAWSQSVFVAPLSLARSAWNLRGPPAFSN